MLRVTIFLLLLSAAGVSSAQSPRPQTDGKENVAGLFSMDDYPAEALKNRWEGDVTVTVHVGTDGRAHSCRIIKSSGHPVLDNQTCAVMFERARFAPARDSFGNAVEDDFVLPVVHWRIDKSSAEADGKGCSFREEGDLPWSAGIPRIVDGDLWAWVYLDLDKGGNPMRCYIGDSNISGPETRSDVCRSFVDGWQATPLMKDGKPVAGTTRRFLVIPGGRHDKLLQDARKTWLAQHPNLDQSCYN